MFDHCRLAVNNCGMFPIVDFSRLVSFFFFALITNRGTLLVEKRIAVVFSLNWLVFGFECNDTTTKCVCPNFYNLVVLCVCFYEFD